MFLNLENIASDVKLSSVFFGINFATTLYGFFLCQEALYHFFGKSDGSTQFFHSQHLFDPTLTLQRKISFSRHPLYPPCHSDHKGGTVHAWGASVTSAAGRETLFTSLADNERLAKKAIVGMILRIIILNE